MSKIDQLAKKLWDYNVLHESIEPADCILALGNSDIRTARRAAELFNARYGGWVITTGGFGRLTKGSFQKPEAQVFADEAIRLGVPKDKILIEDQSSSTFENLRFTQRHLIQKNIQARSFIIVTKPYMERRALATVKKRWPGKIVRVTSPSLSYEEYPNENIPKDLFINMLVGDTQRVLLYGKLGYLEIQEVPKEVLVAMNELISLGFDKQLTTVDMLPR